ncbi:MAG TPA: tRNA lysidine(34) synthetase TilS [Candidatus Limnocylindria bacterium]|nr:tRNA lysidine(34) synthetase TilS [Candidatus Limnocylindria bacterium]
MLADVRAFSREHDLLRPGPLVVAVSGGADSTALLLILSALAPEHGLVLHVAHFDHRTRPRAAAADAQFVADLAASLGLPVRVGRAERRPASEDDARAARYAFLRRAAGELGATAIATGHTRDDQAETVLLHAVRGSGLAGLAAMRPERDGVVRPLLALGRDATREACAAAGIVPREDPTNRSLRFARNRIRAKVMPELARLNPQAPAALARVADAAADALATIRRGALAALEAATSEGAILLERLDGDPVLREEALALAWERATGRVLSARARGALAALGARRDGSSALDLPGGRAERAYGSLTILTSPAADGGPPPETPLRNGEEIVWGEWTLALSAAPPEGRWDAVGRVRETELVVRARRAGDRIGSAKVQDLLTDAKVPARGRDRVPLVVTRMGDVIWIPCITETEDGALHISAKRSGSIDVT